MIRVKRNLKTLDHTILLEFVVQVLVTALEWDLSNEDVVVKKLLFVASLQLLVELQCSAPFPIDLEISHFL